MRRYNKRVAGFIAASIVVGGGGVAYAYWSTSGLGTGSAATDTVVPITLVQPKSISGLYPGGPAQAIQGTFTNTNASSVHVSTITAALNLPADSGCLATDFLIGNTTDGNKVTVSVDVPGSTPTTPSKTTPWTGPTIQMLNTDYLQNTCQGKDIPLTLTSN